MNDDGENKNKNKDSNGMRLSSLVLSSKMDLMYQSLKMTEG